MNILRHIKLCYTLFLFVIWSNTAFAQQVLCRGSLGDPVVNLDFGRGAAPFGSAIPETNFNHLAAGTPDDGYYTIGKSTTGMYDTWHRISNHTINDPDGYMMIVNASYWASTFYEATINDLCPNTTYEFAAWIINLMKLTANKPNLTFTFRALDGTLLNEFETGDIQESTIPTWLHQGGLFVTPPGATSVRISIRNNGPGGYGNDIAIDDITFRPCGAVITPVIDGVESGEKTLCDGEDEMVTLTANVSPGSYANPQYLWQKNVNGLWQDIPTQTTDHFTESFENAPLGTYKYRLFVADAGNINSPKCRVISPEFEITLISKPVPVVTSSITVCVGDQIKLSVSQASSYSWTGPGFSSTAQSPVIENATTSMSGNYIVKVANQQGCESTAEIAVLVLPPPVAAIEPIAPICKGAAVALNASGGTVYHWTPSTGLSNVNIANPIANPNSTTTYTVNARNGSCESEASITVVVDNAFASAGPDRQILEGQQIELQGTVSDHSNFYWSPETGLDDPTKLNPKATPSSDVTYTLIAESLLGCSSAVDAMTIKVFKKVIVPNTFSPNSDGINDLWNIAAIGAYPKAKVKIVNRYGQLLFESSGYEKPWDGKYGNQDVPVGVYYYSIDLNSELPVLSGSLMVIR